MAADGGIVQTSGIRSRTFLNVAVNVVIYILDGFLLYMGGLLRYCHYFKNNASILMYCIAQIQ